MNFKEVINNRWSVRSFADIKVEDGKIQNIIDYAYTAPTAKNTNPVRTYVITSPEMLEKVDGVSRCRYGATAVFAVCYDENIAWKEANERSRGEMDASIAATYIMLAAANEGLGSCWVCLFDADKARELLQLPQNEKPACFIMVGYPAEDAEPSERHTIRPDKDVAFKIL